MKYIEMVNIIFRPKGRYNSKVNNFIQFQRKFNYIKLKTIIAVGFRIDTKNNYYTGQAAMIDLFIDIAQNNKFQVIPVALNYKIGSDTKVGTTSILRIIDYFRIFSIIFYRLVTHPGSILYFSPVSNKIGFYRDAAVVYFAKLVGCKVFMQQFGCRFESFYETLSPLMQKIVRRTYMKATIITTEGMLAKDQLSILNLDNKILIVNNGLPEKSIIEIKEGKEIDLEKPFILLYLNNMIESKGYLDVLKATDILVNKYHKNIKTIFAGKFMSVIDDKIFKSTEEAKKYFFEFIKIHNLLNNIEYYPGLFGVEKAKIFIACNVFLLPTYYVFEGQPTVILEALAYGALPIVTRHSLIPEMINEDCGKFVDKQSPDSIVRGVLDLLNDHQEYHRLSSNCIIRFQENYTIKSYSEKIIKIIKLKFN